MYKSILVAFDLSQKDRGLKILRRAKALADEGCEIKVVHVVDEVPAYIEYQIPQDVIDDNVEKARAELMEILSSEDIEAEIALRRGRPHHEILQLSRDMKADLIIIASHNPGIQDYLIGSTAARVTRHASCSVLIDR